MTGTESNGLSQLKSPDTSHISDEEIIMAQIQSALNSTVQLADLHIKPEKKKRKSQHKTHGEHEDGYDSARKKKARGTERASQLVESLPVAMENSIVNTPEKEERHFVEPTNGLQSNKPLVNTKTESVIRPPKLFQAQDKASALMQSILKDCTPEKVNERQFKSFTSPEREAEENAPTIGGGVEVALKVLSPDVSTPSLPTGYVAGPHGVKGRYPCPVGGCTKKYTRRRTIIGHLMDTHGDQELIDNGDGTMTAVLPKQESNRSSSVTESNVSCPIFNREFVEAINLPAKELASESEVSSAVIRPTSTPRIVPSTKVIHNPRANISKSGGEGGMLVTEVQPPASVSADQELRRKGRKLVNSANGSYQDDPRDVYLHGAETVMSSWEVKPGVIRASRRLGGEGFEVEQNIAFSAAHIASESNRIKLPGIEFQLCRISAGTDRIWATDSSCDRIYSVASGKVQVSVGKKGFSIGAHGMWRVPCGVSCTTANLCYAEAVLHVCTIKSK